MTPVVSVITPCYNAAAYIAQAIESVQTQTFGDWEMLIVDDGSTDDSAAIISCYQAVDARIRYIRMQTPSGSPTQPRNTAISQAKGRFIAFLDSDDLWLPNKLEEQLRLFDERTAIVFSDYERIAEDGTRRGKVVRAPSSATYRDLLKGNVIGNLTGIYDAQKVGKVYCQAVHHEDYVLWLSILKYGHMARNTGEVHALYRVRSQSVSADKLQVITWQWHIYREVECLNWFQSVYYLLHYALKAIRKRW